MDAGVPHFSQSYRCQYCTAEERQSSHGLELLVDLLHILQVSQQLPDHGSIRQSEELRILEGHGATRGKTRGAGRWYSCSHSTSSCLSGQQVEVEGCGGVLPLPLACAKGGTAREGSGQMHRGAMASQPARHLCVGAHGVKCIHGSETAG